MSKVTYHKHGQIHAEAKKAKRMLCKIEKDFIELSGSIYLDIAITGIKAVDRKEVGSHVERHLNCLKQKIDMELLRNQLYVNGNINEDYEEGFWLRKIKEEVRLADELNKVREYIDYSYPEPTRKRCHLFEFTKQDAEERKQELIAHFKKNPINGFTIEWYGVLENGNTKRLYPFTMTAQDTENIVGVYAEFF